MLSRTGKAPGGTGWVRIGRKREMQTLVRVKMEVGVRRGGWGMVKVRKKIR